MVSLQWGHAYIVETNLARRHNPALKRNTSLMSSLLVHFLIVKCLHSDFSDLWTRYSVLLFYMWCTRSRPRLLTSLQDDSIEGTTTVRGSLSRQISVIMDVHCIHWTTFAVSCRGRVVLCLVLVSRVHNDPFLFTIPQQSMTANHSPSPSLHLTPKQFTTSTLNTNTSLQIFFPGTISQISSTPRISYSGGEPWYRRSPTRHVSACARHQRSSVSIDISATINHSRLGTENQMRWSVDRCWSTLIEVE